MSGVPKPIQILVVDDNPGNREWAGRQLRQAGYEILEAESGQEALKLAKKKPDVIVLGGELPDIQGLEVCRNLKADPATAAIPIIQTSDTATKIKEKALGAAAAADGYLIAPWEPEKLVATVKTMLRLRSAETEAEILAREWQATFDAIGDGICLVDAEGKIKRCNRTFVRLVGGEAREFIGRDFAEEMERAKINPDFYFEMSQTGARVTREIHRENAELNITIDPVRGPDGQRSSAACILHDIRAQRAAEIELHGVQDKLREYAEMLEMKVEERTEKLNNTIQSLQGFCYSIAHDLQAPLRNMRSFTAVLREGYNHVLDKDGQEYTRRIDAAAVRMQQLIVDLLSYGQLSHADVPLAAVSLESVVAEVLTGLEPEIKERGAVVTVVKPLPAITGNRRLVEQIITNLVDNALKFRKPNRVSELKIWTEENGATIKLWIEDNGIGIEPRHFELIFRLFERLHANNSEYPGTGIGLAIVAKAMERMGGRAGVESTLDAGSKFWLEFQAKR